MRRFFVFLSVICVAVTLALSACGDSVADEVAATSAATTTAATTSAAPTTTSTTTTQPTTTTTTAATTTTTTTAATTTTTTTTTVPPQPFDPLDLSLTIEWDFAIGTAVFTAEGPAVDAGVMCASGTAMVARGEFNRVLCDEPKGGFSIIDEGESSYDGNVTTWVGIWWVEDGSKAFEGLSGEGEMTFVVGEDEGVGELTGQIWRSG